MLGVGLSFEVKVDKIKECGRGPISWSWVKGGKTRQRNGLKICQTKQRSVEAHLMSLQKKAQEDNVIWVTRIDLPAPT